MFGEIKTYLNAQECCISDLPPERIGEILVDASPGKDGKKIVLILSGRDKNYLAKLQKGHKDVGQLLHDLVNNTLKNRGIKFQIMKYSYHESGLFTIIE